MPPYLLSLSDTLSLPADAAVQKFAWLGISGSGKTYGCGKFVEELVRYGAQVIILDTIGNWWGLRLAADGKAPGLQIPILGGNHGDIELDPGHGNLVAQTAIESGSSMVVDVSDFTGGELRRFVIDFATEMLRLARTAPSPRHIVWEECQDIVPQKTFGEDIKVLGAVQRLIKKGRNYGVGTSLISQRVAAVNKECLNQCHTVFAFRTIGKLDRKSIEDWREVHADDATLPPLSKLPTGNCLVYSPEWLKITGEITISKKWTYDASATPDFTKKPVSMALAKVDLDKFKVTMAEAIQKSKDNDPQYLKKRIAELEARTDLGAVTPGDPGLRAAHAEALDELADLKERIVVIRAAAERADEYARRTADLVTDNMRIVREAIAPHLAHVDHVQGRKEFPRPAYDGPAMYREANPPRPPEPISRPPQAAPRARNTPPAIDGMSDRARDFLRVLVQRGGSISKHKILLFAGWAPSGKASDAFAELVREGWATAGTGTGELTITQAGRVKLGRYEPLPVGDALYKSVLEGDRIDERGKAFLRELGRHYPNKVAKADLLKNTGWSPSGKASDAFAALVSFDYAVKEGSGFLRLSDDLTSNPRRA